MAKIRREDLILINRDVTLNGVTAPQTFKVEVGQLPGSASTDGPGADPVGGDMYYDEATNILYVYNETDSKYSAIGSGKGDSAPSEGAVSGDDPVEGQLFYDTNNKELLVYDGTDFGPVGYTTLAQLEDTNIVDPDGVQENGYTQTLVYDGGEWQNQNLPVADNNTLGLVKVDEEYLDSSGGRNPSQIRIDSEGTLYFESPFNAPFNFLETRDLRLVVGSGSPAPDDITDVIGSIYIHVPAPGASVASDVVSSSYDPNIGGESVREGDVIILGDSGWFFGGSVTDTDLFQNFVEITGDEMTGDLTLSDGTITKIEVRKNGIIVINDTDGDEAVKIEVGKLHIGQVDIVDDLITAPKASVDELTVGTKAVVPQPTAGDEAVNLDYANAKFVNVASDNMEGALKSRADFGDGSAASDEEFVPKKYIDTGLGDIEQKVDDLDSVLGELSLDDLTDVNYPSAPGDGQILVWNPTGGDGSGAWEPQDLGELTDGGLIFEGQIDLTSAPAGQANYVDPPRTGHMYENIGVGNVNVVWGADILNEPVSGGEYIAYTAKGTWVFLGSQLDDGYVSKTGDTMSGNLVIDAADLIAKQNASLGGGCGFDVVLNAKTTVKCDTNFEGSVTIGGDLNLDGDLNGDINLENVTIGGDLIVDSIQIENGATIEGGISIDGGLQVDDITVSGDAHFDGDVTIAGDLNVEQINAETISGGVIEGDTINISNGATIEGGASVDGGLTVEGGAQIDQIEVSNGATIEGGLEVDQIEVSNGATIEGGLEVDQIEVSNGATIGGGVSIDGGLDVDTINTPVTIGGDCTDDVMVIHAPLDVKCKADFEDDVTIEGNLNFPGPDGGVEINGEGVTVGGFEFVKYLGDIDNVTDSTPTAANGADVVIVQDASSGEWTAQEASIASELGAGVVKVVGVDQEVTAPNGTTASSGIGITDDGEIYSVLPSSVTFKGPIDVLVAPTAQTTSALATQYALTDINTASLQVGDIFINVTADGNPVTSTTGWGGVTGQSVDANQLVGWDGSDWQLMGTIEGVNLTEYVRIQGDRMTGDLELGALNGAAKITLDASQGEGTFDGTVTVADATAPSHALNETAADKVYVKLLQDTMQGDLYSENTKWSTYSADQGRDGDLFVPKKYVDGLGDSVAGELQDVNDTLAEHQTSIEGLDGRVTTIEGAVSQHGDRLDSVEGIASDNHDSIIGLDGRVTTIEGAVTDIQNSISGGLGAKVLDDLEDVDASVTADGNILKTDGGGEFVVGELFVANNTMTGGVKVAPQFKKKDLDSSGGLTGGTHLEDSFIGIDEDGVIFCRIPGGFRYVLTVNAVEDTPFSATGTANALDFNNRYQTGDIFVNTYSANSGAAGDADGLANGWVSEFNNSADFLTVSEGDMIVYITEDGAAPSKFGKFVNIGKVNSTDLDNVVNKGGDTMTGNLVIDGGDLIVNGSSTLGGGCASGDEIVLNAPITIKCDAEFEGNVTVDGSLVGPNGDSITISGDLNVDSINVNGGATIGGGASIDGGLQVDSIVGGALIDGPVTIGGDCASADVTVMRGDTRFDCDIRISPDTDGALGLDKDIYATTLKADVESGSPRAETQTLQSKSGTVALLEDVTLSEALYLGGAIDVTSVGPTGITSDSAWTPRPGSGGALVRGDVVLATDSGTIQTQWLTTNPSGKDYLINGPDYIARGSVSRGDRFIYIPDDGTDSDQWLFLEVATTVDLNVTRLIDKNIITNTAGDDAELHPATFTFYNPVSGLYNGEAGLMRPEDLSNIADLKDSVSDLEDLELNDLKDVDIDYTQLSDGGSLVWNGTGWEEGPVVPETLGSLSNVKDSADAPIAPGLDPAWTILVPTLNITTGAFEEWAPRPIPTGNNLYVGGAKFGLTPEDGSAMGEDRVPVYVDGSSAAYVDKAAINDGMSIQGIVDVSYAPNAQSTSGNASAHVNAVPTAGFTYVFKPDAPAEFTTSASEWGWGTAKVRENALIQWVIDPKGGSGNTGWKVIGYLDDSDLKGYLSKSGGDVYGTLTLDTRNATPGTTPTDDALVVLGNATIGSDCTTDTLDVNSVATFNCDTKLIGTNNTITGTWHSGTTIGGSTHHDGHTVTGEINTGDALTVKGGINFNDTVNVGGDLILCGNLSGCDPSNKPNLDIGDLNVDGEVTLNGDVTIGGATCGSTTLEVNSKVEFECETYLRNYEYLSSVPGGTKFDQAVDHTRIVASSNWTFGSGDGNTSGDTNHIQKLQAKSATFAYMDDVLLSEALVLIDSVESTSWDGTSTKSRPGVPSGTRVAGDVFVNVDGSPSSPAVVNATLLNLIRNEGDLFNDPANGISNAVVKGDKFVYLPADENDLSQDIYLFLPAPSVIDLSVSKTSTTNTILNTGGTNAILEVVNDTDDVAGLVTKADKIIIDNSVTTITGGAGIDSTVVDDHTRKITAVVATGLELTATDAGAIQLKPSSTTEIGGLQEPAADGKSYMRSTAGGSTAGVWTEFNSTALTGLIQGTAPITVSDSGGKAVIALTYDSATIINDSGTLKSPDQTLAKSADSDTNPITLTLSRNDGTAATGLVIPLATSAVAGIITSATFDKISGNVVKGLSVSGGLTLVTTTADTPDLKVTAGTGIIVDAGATGTVKNNASFGTFGTNLVLSGTANAQTTVALAGGTGITADGSTANSVTFNLDAASTTEIGGVLEIPTTSGEEYVRTYDAGVYKWVESTAGASCTVSPTPPTPAEEGDLWWNSDDSDPDGGALYIYYIDSGSAQWVQTNGSGGGADGYAGVGPIGIDDSSDPKQIKFSLSGLTYRSA